MMKIGFNHPLKQFKHRKIYVKVKHLQQGNENGLIF